MAPRITSGMVTTPTTSRAADNAATTVIHTSAPDTAAVGVAILNRRQLQQRVRRSVSTGPVGVVARPALLVLLVQLLQSAGQRHARRPLLDDVIDAVHSNGVAAVQAQDGVQQRARRGAQLTDVDDDAHAVVVAAAVLVSVLAVRTASASHGKVRHRRTVVTAVSRADSVRAAARLRACA